MAYNNETSEIQSLLPGYLQRRWRDIERIRSYYAETKFEEIARIAHKIKGTGAAYNMPELSDVAEEIEVAAKACDANRLQELINCIAKLVSEKLQKLTGKKVA